ncbi:MAG TPA: hypothetical protein EYG78_05705, partial [Sulfurovum sp.]|nr:hypothetical protein [Sulfurovum sp.]
VGSLQVPLQDTVWLGNYRLFYLIENDKLIIAVVDFRHRQQAYD